MRWYLAISFITLFHWQAVAQRYSFLQRGVEEGLPVPVINDIERDPTGMIWLATDGGGLVKFDGERFETFRLNDSLPSLFVTCIYKDQSDRFWIGTERGLMIYDGSEIEFVNGSPESRINGFAQHENQIWIASRDGLHLVENGVARPHDVINQEEVLSIATINNQVHYSTKKGAFVLGGRPDAKQFDEGEEIKKVIAIREGFLTCTAMSCTYHVNSQSLKIDVAGVRDAVLSDQGVLWLASQKSGLVRVREGVVERINSTNGLQFERARTILLDGEKVWLGSQQGLSFLQNPNAFAIDGTQGLDDESVHAALLMGGERWLGTSSGVYRIRQNKTVDYFGSDQGLPNGIVFDLIDHQGVVWAATEQGIARYKNGQFVQATEAQGFDADFTFCIHTDSNLITIGAATGSYAAIGQNRYVSIPFVDSIPDGIVQISNGHRAEYHVGISGALYENTINGLKRVLIWNDMPIDTLNIFAMASSPKYECLLVNGDGIYISIGTAVRHIGGVHGLKSLSFKAVCFVGDRLWVTTDAGMQFVDVTPNGKKPFVVGNVSAVSSINPRTFNVRGMTSQNGLLLNGSQDGLLVLSSQACSVQPVPDLSIHEVNLFFQSQTDWSSFAEGTEKWTGFPQNLELPHDQNYLSFRFNVSPADVYDEEVFMRFRLKGQDDQWSYANGRREATYSSINNGQFTFEVEASRSADFTNVARASFQFRVVPPFWKTWWFITGLVLFIGGAVTLFVRMRIQQLNEKLELRSALADSERKSLRLQMNPHFVFNALDAISGFIFKNEPKEAVRYLGSFAKLMRLTLETSRERLVPLQSELQLLKNYIDLEQLRFNHKFDYTLDVDEEIDPYETYLPPMLIQPFVENAIKHGLKHREGTDGQLTVHFAKVDDHLICEVTDNGVGREHSAALNQSKNKQSLATSITQERIALLTKSLGAPVKLQIIDLKAKDGSSTGTKAIVSFPHVEPDPFT